MVDDRTLNRITEKVEDYNGRVRQVRADPTLSDLGKQQRLAELYERTAGEVATLRGTSEQSGRQRARELERKLFGLNSTDPSAIIAYRDAQDRVSRAKSPQELADLMDRADSSGDTTLLRAGFAMAAQRSRDSLTDGWDNITAEHLSQSPGDAKDFEEYSALSSSRGLTEDFAVRMAMSVPRPTELNGGGRRSDVTPTPRVPAPSNAGLAPAIGGDLTEASGSATGAE